MGPQIPDDLLLPASAAACDHPALPLQSSQAPVTSQVAGTLAQTCKRPRDALNPALQNFVLDQIVRWGRRIWPNAVSGERRLRRQCLCNRLCCQAQEKYHDVMLASASSWREYLTRSSGQKRVNQWIDKKVREYMAKENS